MINGRILISDITINRWIQEAIEADVERVTLAAEADNEADREWARTANTGRARIDSLLDDHCECWCFGRADRQLILSVVLPIYEESRKFLDL